MDEPRQTGGPTRAALFVDFDNIYIGLRNIHPKAAEKFATDPKRWLAWFEQGMPSLDQEAAPGLRRRILLRLCYLNPKTFQEYRPDFTRSAFKVVDCPPLTSQNKNSTDIHMVMDILDAMRHETRFDEFIILSGDSDFTPVLLRLRSHDRRTVILTAGAAAPAYKAASDHVIGVDAFIENGLGIQPERVARAASTTTAAPNPPAAPKPAAAPKSPATPKPAAPKPVRPTAADDLRTKILTHVGRLVAKSAEAVVMAAAAGDVIQTFGDQVQQTRWAGAGSFKKLLVTAEGRGFDIAMGGAGTSYLYDPARHAPPVTDIFVEKWKKYPEKLSAFAHRVNSVTGTPLLTPEGYAVVFSTLEEELRDNQYLLTATSKAVHDRCVERGSPVQRRAINFILQGITYAGHKFDENSVSNTAAVFAKVFGEQVLTLCKDAQLVLSKAESGLLKNWIRA